MRMTYESTLNQPDDIMKILVDHPDDIRILSLRLAQYVIRVI